jgi:hypothetical protein
MRIRQIAAMASGHDQQTLGQALALDSREPVRGFLLIPPDRPPGTVFAYNQPCTFPGDTAPDGHLCSLDDQCASAAWRVPPLGGVQLQDLRNPI